jgi:hypothetical protein
MHFVPPGVMKYFKEGIVGEHIDRHSPVAYIESVESVTDTVERLTLAPLLIKPSLAL